MQRSIRWMMWMFLTVFTVMCILTFAACKNGGEEETEGESKYTVTVNVTEWSLYCYEDVQLTAEVKDSEGNAVQTDVEWSSSSAAVATVDGNGRVIAASAGSTEIIASAEGAQAKCSLTVLAAQGQPSLVLSDDETLPIAFGDPYRLQPCVLYNGNRYYDATFTFNSEDETVMTVDASTGDITTVASGEAILTATATWRGLDAQTLSDSITVQVIDNVQIFIDAGCVSQLYTTDKDLGDGKTYVKTAVYTATVNVNGTAQTGADIVWSADGDAVSIDSSSGRVTAVKAGTASIYASYTYAETQKKYTSSAFTINVTMPYIDRTSSVELLMGKDDEQNPLSASEVFVDGGDSAIQTITDVTTADTTSVTYADGYVTAGLVEGARIWEVGNGEYSVRVKAEVVTNVIRKAEDLQLFNFTSGTEIYSGTYVLANDIDASSYTHYKQNWGGGAYGSYGLRGTFDGRGHTISGITLRYGGLFGSIGADGQVKNVAFKDVKLYDEDNTCVLATYACALTTVQDVFISIASWPTGDRVCAPLICQTKPNSGGSVAPEFTRIVVVTPDRTGTWTKAYGSLLADGGLNNIKGDYSEVYVISTVNVSKATDTIEGVKRYDTAADFKAANNNLSSFSADIWDLSGDYPVFK